MLNTFITEIINASAQTMYMVLLSTLGAVLLGWPIGTLLYISERLHPQKTIAKCLALIINMSRSIPFIILMVALLPFTRWLLGSAIGINAAIIPLTLGATPLFARLTAQAYEQIPDGILECAASIGANPFQIIQQMLFKETIPLLVDAITMTSITLIGYSAMAGAIGGGGLGDLAIRYGYQRFDTEVMVWTVVILIMMVQLIQWLGQHIRKKIQH
ncbi:MAG TPA: methionine ABC transporter permease [Legionellales bacterium]|nr:methionine ABC transporter permease [Legionellales bacterium]